MTIHIGKAYDAFKDYIPYYDSKSPKVALKTAHILRVAKLQRQLAHIMGATEEDIALADLIGLLHDIGRYEQIKRYDSFRDSETVDHAALGCEILFDGEEKAQGLIRRFIEDPAFDSIIYQAVFYHNKLELPDSITEPRALFHSKLIRDTDKIDNFKVNYEEPNIALFSRDDVFDDVMNLAIYDDFFKGNLVSRSLIKNNSAPDTLVCLLAFVHDLNFDESYKMILDSGYLDLLPKRHVFRDEETNRRLRELIEATKSECAEHASRIADTGGENS